MNKLLALLTLMLLPLACGSSQVTEVTTKQKCVTFEYAVEKSVYLAVKAEENGISSGNNQAQRSLAWSAIAANLREGGHNNLSQMYEGCLKLPKEN